MVLKHHRGGGKQSGSVCDPLQRLGRAVQTGTTAVSQLAQPELCSLRFLDKLRTQQEGSKGFLNRQAKGWDSLHCKPKSKNFPKNLRTKKKGTKYPGES